MDNRAAPLALAVVPRRGGFATPPANAWGEGGGGRKRGWGMGRGGRMAPRSAGRAAPRPAACDGGGAAAVVEEERRTATCPSPPRPGPLHCRPAPRQHAPGPTTGDTGGNGSGGGEAEEKGAQTAVSSSRTARTRRRWGGEEGSQGTRRRRRHCRSYSATYALVRWTVADLLAGTPCCSTIP